jgi:hypothetical protein
MGTKRTCLLFQAIALLPLNRIQPLVIEYSSQFMLAFSRFLHNHPHPLLLIAVMLGVGSGFLLPDQWRVVTQVLVAWNIMVWSYLLLTGWLMLQANHIRMLKIASQEDEHGATILAMFSIVTVASLVAIVLELSDQELKTGFHLSIPSPKFKPLLHESCQFLRLGRYGRRLKMCHHFCPAN